MTRRFQILVTLSVANALALTLVGILWFERPARAQAPVTGYEGLLLCSLPGATKAEGQYATGISSIFSETFTVRTRNWRWLSGPRLWQGEWWLRDASGMFRWVPVGTGLNCSYYPATLSEDWIVPEAY